MPELHRVVPAPNDQGSYLIMTRIHGRVLSNAWASLSWWRTLRLGFQLAGFVKLMRGVTSLVGGSLSTGVALCAALDEDKFGPDLRVSPSAFAEYINWWTQLSRPPRFSARPEFMVHPEKTHVFNHMDLSPHNMIMDDNYLLWLIDWQDCGFYPPYMEHDGMRLNMILDNTWTGVIAHWRWQLFRWMVTGSHPREQAAVSMVRNRSMAFPQARQGLPSGRQA